MSTTAAEASTDPTKKILAMMQEWPQPGHQINPSCLMPATCVVTACDEITACDEPTGLVFIHYQPFGSDSRREEFWVVPSQDWKPGWSRRSVDSLSVSQARQNQAKLEASPAVGTRWQHYKGGTYRVVATGIHVQTFEPMIAYRSDTNEVVWARTLLNWSEAVDLPSGGVVRRFFPLRDCLGPTPTVTQERINEPAATWAEAPAELVTTDPVPSEYPYEAFIGECEPGDRTWEVGRLDVGDPITVIGHSQIPGLKRLKIRSPWFTFDESDEHRFALIQAEYVTLDRPKVADSPTPSPEATPQPEPPASPKPIPYRPAPGSRWRNRSGFEITVLGIEKHAVYHTWTEGGLQRFNHISLVDWNRTVEGKDGVAVRLFTPVD